MHVNQQPLQSYIPERDEWLEVMVIYFQEGKIYRIDACHQGANDILSQGWYKIEGDDLKRVAVRGAVQHNAHLFPDKPQSL